jgi:hypothetical protein
MRHKILLIILSLPAIHFRAQNWQKLPGPVCAEVNVIEASRHAAFTSVAGHGLFVSANQGQSWVNAGTTTLTNAAADTSLLVGISNDSLFATTNGVNIKRRSLPYPRPVSVYVRNGIIYSGGYWSGGKVSNDTGQTWYNMAWNFRTLAITDSAMYACEIGLKISRNGGVSWTVEPAVTNTMFVTAIAVNNSHVWVLYTDRLYHSADDGRNWSLQYPHPWMALRDIAVFRDTVYITTDESLLRSHDNGNTWSAVPRSVYFNSNASTFLAAGKDKLLRAGFGIYRLNGGSTWSRGDNGFNYANIWRLKAMDGLVFALTYRDMYYSPDLGNTWKLCKPLDTSAAGWHLCHFSHGVLLAADFHKGVYKSLDTGSTWQYVGLNNVSYFTGGLAYNPPDIYCSDSYFTSNGPNWENQGRIHKTSNGGVSWQLTVIDTLITPYAIPSTELVSSGTTLLYARNKLHHSFSGSAWSRCNDTTYYPRNLHYGSGHFYCLSHSCLYVSDAQASNWGVLRDFNNGGIQAFTVQGPNICVLSRDTLHYSANGGLSWSLLSSPPPGVKEICIAPPYLFASIELNSVWRLPIMTITEAPEVELPEEQSLLWPNPASETVQFHEQCAAVRIVDLNGRLVVTGNATPIDVRALPRGIYICELYVKDKIQRVKLAVN